MDKPAPLWIIPVRPQGQVRKTGVTHSFWLHIHTLSPSGAQGATTPPKLGVHRVIPRLWMMNVALGEMAGYRQVTLATQVWTTLWKTLSPHAGSSSDLSAGLVTNPVCQLRDLVVDRAALGHQLTDLAVSMHHRGVVPPAKKLPDLG